MGGGDPLVLAGVEGHGPPQPPQLVHHGVVEATEGLGHQGHEGEALPLAELAGIADLPGVGEGQGVPGCGGCPRPGGGLEGVGDGDVQGRVQGTGPPGDQDVGWPPELV